YSEVIRCELSVIRLIDPPEYETLSYDWRSPSLPGQVIFCSQVTTVTLNLEAAIRRIRPPQIDRLVWIDALCINQNDLEERSEQVQLMTNVFLHALKIV
ncbi:heterokaryon incompatibility protein-domain-containing protein, partial [Bisporella sp. PMI_857]